MHLRHDLGRGEIKFFTRVVPALLSSGGAWSGPARKPSRARSRRPEFDSGRELGRNVTRALGYETGFTHMEWFRKANGEAVFGEIAARPPGAHSVDIMNFGSDIDTFTGWAEAVVHRTLSMKFERLYNCAIIFKRAQGQGRIQRVEGLDRVLSSFGEHVVLIDLLPIGAHRRNWVQTLLSDGFIVVRHPDLQTTLDMADRVGTDVQIYAA